MIDEDKEIELMAMKLGVSKELWDEDMSTARKIKILNKALDRIFKEINQEYKRS